GSSDCRSSPSPVVFPVHWQRPWVCLLDELRQGGLSATHHHWNRSRVEARWGQSVLPPLRRRVRIRFCLPAGCWRHAFPILPASRDCLREKARLRSILEADQKRVHFVPLPRRSRAETSPPLYECFHRHDQAGSERHVLFRNRTPKPSAHAVSFPLKPRMRAARSAVRPLDENR